jgi:hypothetical protein
MRIELEHKDLPPLRPRPKIGYESSPRLFQPDREPHVPQDAHQTPTMNAGPRAQRPFAHALKLLLISP